MYLSKLVLNPRSREARRDLARPYELHRTLARAFTTPERQDYRAAHGVLFRLEAALPGQLPTVLVQSLTAPDWRALPPDYLGCDAQEKPVVLAFTPGQVLGFRLLANPTRKVAREGRSQGQRVPLLDKAPDDGPTPARHWLHRKAALSGFEVLHVLSEDFQLPLAPSASAKQQVPFYGVRFDGLLRVHDPELLTLALRQGIGSAKAFGFGLLSLARSS